MKEKTPAHRTVRSVAVPAATMPLRSVTDSSRSSPWRAMTSVRVATVMAAALSMRSMR